MNSIETKPSNPLPYYDYFKTYIYDKCKQAIEEHRMIQPGDKVALEVTWDSNSLTMLAFFLEYQKERENDFSLEFFVETNEGNVKEILKEVLDSVGVSTYHKVEANHKQELYDCMMSSNCNRIALHQNYNQVVKATMMTYLKKKKKTVVAPVFTIDGYDITMIRPMFMVKDESIVNWVSKVGVNVGLADKITLFGGVSISEEGLVDIGLHSSAELQFNVYERA